MSAPLLRPEPTTPIHVDEPGAPEPELPEPLEAPEPAVAAPSTTTPLSEELLTLSDVAPSKVLATLHLELVKERNKLTEPLKPLPNAPFFLPTQQGVTPRFSAPLGEEEAPTPERPSLLEQITTKATGATSALEDGRGVIVQPLAETISPILQYGQDASVSCTVQPTCILYICVYMSTLATYSL